MYEYAYQLLSRTETIEKHDGTVITFDNAPFVEMSPTHRQNQKIEIKKGEPLKFTSSEEWISSRDPSAAEDITCILPEQTGSSTECCPPCRPLRL